VKVGEALRKTHHEFTFSGGRSALPIRKLMFLLMPSAELKYLTWANEKRIEKGISMKDRSPSFCNGAVTGLRGQGGEVTPVRADNGGEGVAILRCKTIAARASHPSRIVRGFLSCLFTAGAAG